MGHLRRLAVDERRRPDDRRAERGRHRLHPEADAEERDRPVAGDLDRRDRDAGGVRVAGPGRDDDPPQLRVGIGGERLDPRPVDRVVADDADVGAGGLERLDEVEREASRSCR